MKNTTLFIASCSILCNIVVGGFLVKAYNTNNKPSVEMETLSHVTKEIEEEARRQQRNYNRCADYYLSKGQTEDQFGVTCERRAAIGYRKESKTAKSNSFTKCMERSAALTDFNRAGHLAAANYNCERQSTIIDILN